jgi:hypothetical protein
MHVTKLALVIASVLALSGCEPVEQVMKEETLSTQLKVAAKQSDPLQAFQTVQAVKATLCPSGECDHHPLWVKAGDDEVKYLTAALKQGNAKAFATVYGPARGNSAASIERVRSQPEIISSLLTYADRLAGATLDEGMLLRYAALLVMEGKYTVRDTTRAATFFARAWAAGDAQAAGLASRLYIADNDYRNAYLWSLRCTGKCERDAQANLDTLQERLNPEAIKQAQQAALDPSVIELTATGV